MAMQTGSPQFCRGGGWGVAYQVESAKNLPSWWLRRRQEKAKKAKSLPIINLAKTIGLLPAVLARVGVLAQRLT